jgi:hypothetical protein
VSRIFLMRAIHSVCFGLTLMLSALCGAIAQVPPRVTPPTPNPNPSSSLVLPAPREVPVSPGPTGTAPAVGAIGGNLAGTNQVVNPPRSVLHHHRRHRSYYAQ